MGSAYERALEIARSAVVRAFKYAKEVTVALPRDWSISISASRTLKGTTELKVKLFNVLKGTEEVVFYRELASAMITAEDVTHCASYVGSHADALVVVKGRFRLKVEYVVSGEAATAFVTVKKV
jgi:hypothetical protein